MLHALSIAIEDWYHDSLVDPRAPRESRAEATTLGVLDMLEEHGVKATFFFWVKWRNASRRSSVRGGATSAAPVTGISDTRPRP
jgi:hypothetical protein